MGILERWTKEYLMIWDMFCCFQAMKGPLGFLMVLNGQTCEPWEFEIKCFSMGRFHYGNTERYSFERWTKEYLMIWGISLLFSGTDGPPKGPRGSPTLLNGQTSSPSEGEIKYSNMGWFHYGNNERFSLERWTKEYLMIWGFFLLFSGNERPPRVLNGSQWTN